MRLGLTIIVLLAIQPSTSCLYTDELGPPPPETENTAPYFYNWLPTSTTVTIGPSGVTFIVYYDDENEEDADRLELQWYLDGRARGNGNQVKIWVEDLGQEGEGVLVANVQDPHDASDSLLWRLEVEPQLSEGE